MPGFQMMVVLDRDDFGPAAMAAFGPTA